MSIGKNLRLKSLFQHDPAHTIIVPMDHGLTLGPIKGINNIENTINILSELTIDGIIVHKGIITACHNSILRSNLSLIMHLSASTTLGDRASKVLVGDVREASAFGCSAVSIHINFGEQNENSMLQDAALVSEQCYKFGMPLIIMAYHKNRDVITSSHIARISAELGADIVKILYPSDDNFTKVVSGCPIPILVAGGESDQNILKTISKAIISGASGVAVGRNIFQSENIHEIVGEIIKVVRITKR